MALAARLSLRMQKELKLLLNDPPPGVSVLPLSDDEGPCSSLSVISASIEGPDGTAYANGFFNIRIQIPERYPFLPPNVTFVTPIYHPNIDNGGRICLDILNMPPKGAWLPSLNISTVLTSISLLLSDPNPDDGLMCEISREYKYNRQVFEQKARSWTERFAKRNNHLSNDACTITTSSEALVTEKEDRNLECHVFDRQRNETKAHMVTEKLSLGCSTVGEKCTSDCEEYSSHCEFSLSSSEASLERAQTSYRNKENDMLCSRLSLSLHKNPIVSKAASHEDKSDYKENAEPKQYASPCYLPNTASVNWNSSVATSKENTRLSLNSSRKNVRTKKALGDSGNTQVIVGSPSKILLSDTSNVISADQSECRVLDDISNVNRAAANRESSVHLKNHSGSGKYLVLQRAVDSNQDLPGQNRITITSITKHKESVGVLDRLPDISKTTEVVIVSDSEESDDDDGTPPRKRLYSSRKRWLGLSTYKRPHI